MRGGAVVRLHQPVSTTVSSLAHEEGWKGVLKPLSVGEDLGNDTSQQGQTEPLEDFGGK